MKQITLFILLMVHASVWSQNLILNVDGEQPNPLSDKTGFHTLITHGQPMDSLGFLVFPNETPFPQVHNYLSADSIFTVFDVNANWVVEFKVYTGAPAEDHFFLDWGSTSTTGHMRFAYDSDRGLHFSDRPVNGQSGFIVADSLMLPQNTWVAVKFEKIGFTFNLYRDGILLETATNSSTLTTPTVVTIAYSEDDRPFHNWYLMDDVKIYTNQPLGIDAPAQVKTLNSMAIGDSRIQLSNPLNKDVPVQLFNLMGQQIDAFVIPAHQRMIKTLPVSNQLYLIQSAEEKYSGKIFVH